MKLTVERLREVLLYDPLTGIFTWRYAVSQRVRIGEVAGSDHEGHRRIYIDRRPYYAQRLAWLYVKGVWPKGQIDHWDVDGFNNVFTNLRDVTSTINAQNRRVAPSHNTSGFMGVHRHPNGWRAKIRYDGRQHCLGVHPTREQAYEKYVAAKRIHHPGCTL